MTNTWHENVSTKYFDRMCWAATLLCPVESRKKYGGWVGKTIVWILLNRGFFDPCIHPCR